MSFLSKLFKKKEKPTEPQEPQRMKIMTEWGELVYLIDETHTWEYAYEGCFRWYDDGPEADIYVECDEEGSPDVQRGLALLDKVMQNRYEYDVKVKMAALDKLADAAGLLPNEDNVLMSKSLFMDKMIIDGIEVKRDGCVEFNMYESGIYDVENVIVILTDKGTYEVSCECYGD